MNETLPGLRARARGATGVSLTEMQGRLKDAAQPIAAATRSALMEPGITLALFGAALALIPPFIVLLAPFMLLLLPLLLPLGTTLSAIGLLRAATVASLSPPRHPPSGASSSAATLSPSSVMDTPRGSTTPGDPDGGSLSRLGEVTAQRGEALVMQVAGALKASVHRATNEVLSEPDTVRHERCLPTPRTVDRSRVSSTSSWPRFRRSYRAGLAQTPTCGRTPRARLAGWRAPKRRTQQKSSTAPWTFGKCTAHCRR